MNKHKIQIVECKALSTLGLDWLAGNKGWLIEENATQYGHWVSLETPRLGYLEWFVPDQAIKNIEYE